MDFDQLLDAVAELLRQRGRLSYPALRKRFSLDEDDLEAVRAELIDARRVAVDEDGKVLVAIESDTPGSARRPAERRQLTVMFCDLVDSTSLAGNLDPEDLRELIRDYQHTVAGVVDRFGGYIAQYLGDGLLVYFGYPRAHEDDARRAVWSGLEILSAMNVFNQRANDRLKVSLQVRIGIHTGLVVIGEIGAGARIEALALGATPNLAARLQGEAEPQTVIVSSATHALLDGIFQTVDLGNHTLRGVSEPVRVFQVIAHTGARSRFDTTLDHKILPLVGRRIELAQLIRTWRRSKRESGRAVLISGNPGIGKSRLIQSLREHVVGEDGGWTILRCSAFHQNTPLYPVADLWAQQLKFTPDEDNAARLARLLENLSQFHERPADIVPVFASLLGIDLPEEETGAAPVAPDAAMELALRTLTEMVVRLGQAGAALLVVEDLQWVDPTSARLISRILDHLPETRLMAVMTARTVTDLGWLQTHSYQHMPLGRLARDEVEQLVSTVAGGRTVDGELLRVIVERTDGVPAFVEELTRMFLETGELRDENGHLKLHGPVGRAIPVTLQDALMARLDRLDGAKALAQLAATLGRRFDFALLSAVTPLSAANLLAEINKLLDAEILVQHGAGSSAVYRFKHAMLQDAAYQSLLKSQRQAYHSQIAGVLERDFAARVAQQPEVLAHHYTAAGMVEPAIGHWQWAGENALKRSGYLEAAAHLNQGLALIEKLPESALRDQRELALLSTLGPALIATQGWASPELEQVYARATEICATSGALESDFQVLGGLCAFHMLRGNTATAHALAQRLHRHAADGPDEQAQLAAETLLGGTSFYGGQIVEAARHLERAMSLYRPDAHLPISFLYAQDPAVIARSWLAVTDWLQGRPESASRHNHEAIRMARRADSLFSLAFALAWDARLHILRGEPERALRRANETIELAQQQNFAIFVAAGTIFKGAALAEGGDHPESPGLIQQGIAMWRATGSESTLPFFMALQARALQRYGRVREAIHAVRDGRSIGEVKGETWWTAELMRLDGELMLQNDGDFVSALVLFQDALGLAREQKAVMLELRAARSWYEHAIDDASRASAHDALVDAFGRLEEHSPHGDPRQVAELLQGELPPGEAV